MLALDHLVYAVPDADAARLKFSARNKLTAYQGGKHEKWGTYNYLSHFRNQCYIEWISLYDESIANKSDNPLIQDVAYWLGKEEEGLIQLALRTDSMDKLVEYYEEKQFPFQGPFEGSRMRPDGSVLAWRMLFPTAPSGTTLPFLIEWDGSPPAPADTSLINKKDIQAIRWGARNLEETKKLWMERYQLPEPPESDPFSWKLDNAEISLVYGTESDYFLS